jgi:prepilin-type N-terminal cleavage/methylation domain-containing protein
MEIVKHKAFTLLELMVVIAMITILAAISVSQMSSVSPDAKLRAAQRELAATIKQAQSYALEGKTIAGSSSATSFGVCFFDNKTYKLVYSDSCSNVVDSIIISNGVTISSLGSWLYGDRVNFGVPGGLPSPSGSAGASLPLTVTLITPSGATKTVTVNNGGSVIEGD